MTAMARTRDHLLRTVIEGGVRLRRLTERPERGDVPGWVLVTLMTAGLVTALWALAGPLLADVFKSAINSVKGP